MIADLTDRVAIVTGGANGIGTGICRVLTRQGASVAVADLKADGAESVARDLGGKGTQALAVSVDVASRESVGGMVSQVLDRFGRVDILVNNAGVIGGPTWVDRQTDLDEDWQTTFAVNVLGVVYVSEAVAEDMKKRRSGKIINIASTAARRGKANMGPYNASKASVVSWTQTNADELAPYNINVNTICPGLLWTPMWETIARRRPRVQRQPSERELSGRPFFEKWVDKLVPLKREQTPEDIGNLAAFLASDEARNITGQAINVDGGIYMN